MTDQVRALWFVAANIAAREIFEWDFDGELFYELWQAELLQSSDKDITK